MTEHRKQATLFVLLGPTGIGKTELAIQIAQLLGCPVINCDSRQIYRHVDIGTAAPTQEQCTIAQHHFVRMLELDEPYSAAQYEQDAISLISCLSSSHPNLLLTGGSMMYLDAVCNGIDDIPSISPEVRTELKARYDTEGLDSLRAELRLIDPEYYAAADLRNPKRIIHALEVYYTSGCRYSSFRTKKSKERDFKIVKVGLCMERAEHFARINARVDDMVSKGLVDEARSLTEYRHLNSMNTVGYKEIYQYLDGNWTLDFAKDKIKKNTRDYAKKQMTWFKHDANIHWFHPNNAIDVKNYIARNAQ